MLNCKQLEYINSPIDRHNVIIARAGTGKTTTILERIKLLIDKYSIKPDRILLTTFTVSATKDMISKLNRNKITNIVVGTLDSIALKTLQKWNQEVLNEKCGITMYTPLFYDFLRYHPNKTKFFEQYDYCFVDGLYNRAIEDFNYKNLYRNVKRRGCFSLPSCGAIYVSARWDEESGSWHYYIVAGVHRAVFLVNIGADLPVIIFHRELMPL